MKTILFSIIFSSLSLFTYADPSEEETELATHMSELSSQLKSLRKVDDADWSGKRAVAQNAQAELLKCFPLIPALLEGVSDAEEKAKLVAEYKKLLAKNYVALCDLELAFIAKDEEKSDELLKTLKSIKKDGHTKFIEE